VSITCVPRVKCEDIASGSVSKGGQATKRTPTRLQTKDTHVRESWKILRRLAGQHRPAHPKILQHTPRSTRVRGRAKGTRAPKNESERATVASLLLAEITGRNQHAPVYQAGKLLASIVGKIQPGQLSPAHIHDANAAIRKAAYSHSTLTNKVSATRRLLRWLWEYHGAPKLDHLVDTYPGLRPRNVTATDEERALLTKAARPYMQLWIALCGDLAIRSTTAARIGPANHDPSGRTLRFETKCGERLTLPTTETIEDLIEPCDRKDPTPFVYQLWRNEPHKHGATPRFIEDPATLRRHFKALRLSVGITRKLTLHDLRRTAAVAMFDYTGDIRDVQALLGHRNLQSTIWYLDHDMRPVKRSTLEIIKRPAWRKEKTA